MKKVIFSLFTILVFILVIFLTVFSLKRGEEINIFTIKESRSILYNQNEVETIDLYSNKSELLIDYEDENVYSLILDESIKITLLNVNVDKSKMGDYYLYTVSYTLPFLTFNDAYKNVILEIINSSYTLKINIGSMKIINEEYNLLSFNNLYGSYSYINDELMLVGINIEIAPDFEAITMMSIGDIAYARFDISLNSLQATEIEVNAIIPSYNYLRVITTNYVSKNKTIFIPLGYIEKYFIRRGTIELIIDETKYIIDAPSFVVNKLDITSYSELKIKGEITYA